MSGDGPTLRKWADLLPAIYSNRFSVDEIETKKRLWVVLVKHFFADFFGPDDVVLDLGPEGVNSLMSYRHDVA